MPETGIPEDIQRFILSSFGSLEKLEVLLLLHRAPDKAWSSEAVYEVIRSSPASVAQRLEELREIGLLKRSMEAPMPYQYSPRSEALGQLVDGLAKAYHERRLRVVELIYADEKDPARRFADAFRIRKDKEQNG